MTRVDLLRRPLLILFLVLLPLASPAGWPVRAAEGDAVTYYVNRNAQKDGDHEVHRLGCAHPANEENRLYLGDHRDCKAAVEAARRHYPTADGCYHCSRACDTG